MDSILVGEKMEKEVVGEKKNMFLEQEKLSRENKIVKGERGWIKRQKKGFKTFSGYPGMIQVQ